MRVDRDRGFGVCSHLKIQRGSGVNEDLAWWVKMDWECKACVLRNLVRLAVMVGDLSACDLLHGEVSSMWPGSW